MKLIHISDLHIGASLYGIDRSSDMRHMLGRLAELIADHRPDCLLIAGDVFDNGQPSASDLRIFTDALAEFRRLHPQLIVVAISGNHDSAARHEAYRPLLEADGIHLIGKIAGDNFDENIVEIPGKGYVAAVPYAFVRNIPAAFRADLAKHLRAMNSANLPCVLMEHTTLMNASPHWDPLRSTGGIDAVSMADIDCLDYYDYVALGHIHKPQRLCDDKASYCGSAIAIGFDEAYPHGANLVEIDAHGNAPHIEFIPIEPLHPLVTIPTNPAPWDEVMACLAEFPDDIPALLRLNAMVEVTLPIDAAEQARKICEGKRARICHIRTERAAAGPTGETGRMTVSTFREHTPIEIARMYAESKGIEFDDDLADMFSQAESSL